LIISQRENDFDIIIIGGGGCGLSAAITATEAGASCMVLEADTKLGGATGLSAGVVYAADTSVQRAAGVEGDTAQAMYDYVMTLAGWEANPKIVRILSDHSGPAVEWLIRQGVEFPPEYLLCSGVDTVPRGHPSLGIADPLINAAGAKGVEVALDTRVESLIYEEGNVVGVRASGTRGSTSSTSRAALSTLRRVPQLGQNPLLLQENATRRSWWQ